MSIKISTDIGGTFTDISICDELGNINVFKTPTTLTDYSKGIKNAIELAAIHYGKTIEELLEKCSSDGGRFIHGSTITTNALLEKKVGKIGLICTRGHRDILTIRAGAERHNPFDWKIEYPEPFVPRYLTMEVTERINSEGEVVVPLNEDDVKKAINELKKFKVEAIAVCLLWAIENPNHEKRIKEIIEEEWPDIPVVLAHELNPSIRELKRTSSASINASLLSVVKKYYSDLEKLLKENGYTGEIAILNSTGGLMSVEEMLEKPIYSVDSGPTMAPVAALRFAELETNMNSLTVVDMGGTSFDISIVNDGEIPQTREAKINHVELGIAKADIKTIGSGGGSIAWIDSGGLLHVGPKSAGSDPGPACYGKGGSLPTVTDANLILGFLNEEYYAGGSMKLRRDLAEKAIWEHIAQPLGLSVKDAAYSIWYAVNGDMATAVEEITSWKGFNPQLYPIVAGGGASGLHIAQICNQIGIKTIISPKVAGTLSAAGGLFADVVGEHSMSGLVYSNNFEFEKINNILDYLIRWAKNFLIRNRVPYENQKYELYCEARYPHQNFELSVPLRQNQFNYQSDVNTLVEDFHKIHEKVYSIKEDTYIECLNWKVKAIGDVEKPQIKKMDHNLTQKSEAFTGYRNIYLGPDIGDVKAAIYRGEKLPINSTIPPDQVAIIETDTTTILSLPGWELTVSKYGNFILIKKG